MTTYYCKDCKEPLKKGPPGILECRKCVRDIDDPATSDKEVKLVKAPMHSLLRKEMLAADAYQTTLPEFPIDYDKLDDIDF